MLSEHEKTIIRIAVASLGDVKFDIVPSSGGLGLHICDSEGKFTRVFYVYGEKMQIDFIRRSGFALNYANTIVENLRKQLEGELYQPSERTNYANLIVG